MNRLRSRWPWGRSRLTRIEAHLAEVEGGIKVLATGVTALAEGQNALAEGQANAFKADQHLLNVAELQLRDRMPTPRIILMVVAFYIAITLGVAWMAVERTTSGSQLIGMASDLRQSALALLTIAPDHDQVTTNRDLASEFERRGLSDQRVGTAMLVVASSLLGALLSWTITYAVAVSNRVTVMADYYKSREAQDEDGS